VPRFGGPDVLELDRNHPDPVPGPDQVVVRVHAASLNHLDLAVREGIPTLKLTLPHILGCDAAGDIAEVGSDVTDVEIGDRVVVNPGISCGRCEYCLRGEDSECVEYKILGEHLPGTYAEKVAVPARNVLKIPTDMDFPQAAAVPLAFMTAWRMLITRAKVRPGEDVLILGAGSGLSTAAIQVAKLAGCTVFTTSSSDAKLEKAKALGADVLVNYKTMPWSKAIWELTGKRGVDVVVDHVGEATFKDSVRSLRKGGRVVVPGATTGALLELDARYLFWRQLSVLGSTMANQREFEEVMKLVFMGRLKPVVDRVFPLEQARQAHEYLGRGEQFGKVVLAIDSPASLEDFLVQDRAVDETRLDRPSGRSPQVLHPGPEPTRDPRRSCKRDPSGHGPFPLDRTDHARPLRGTVLPADVFRQIRVPDVLAHNSLCIEDRICASEHVQENDRVDDGF